MTKLHPFLILRNSLFPYLLEDSVFIGRPAEAVRKNWKDKLLGNSKVEVFKDYSYMFNEKGDVVSPPLPVDYPLEAYDSGNGRRGSISVYKKGWKWEIKKEGTLSLFANGIMVESSLELNEIGATIIEIENRCNYIPLGKILFHNFDAQNTIPLTKELKRNLSEDLKYIDEKIKEIEEKNSKRIWGWADWAISTPDWLSPLYLPSYSGCMKEKDYFLSIKWAIEDSLRKGKIEGNAKLVFEVANCPYLYEKNSRQNFWYSIY